MILRNVRKVKEHTFHDFSAVGVHWRIQGVDVLVDHVDIRCCFVAYSMDRQVLGAYLAADLRETNIVLPLAGQRPAWLRLGLM